MGSTVARLCHWSNVFQLKLGFGGMFTKLKTTKKCWDKCFSGLNGCSKKLDLLGNVVDVI